MAVDAATSVQQRGDRSGFDIRHKAADGSQMVITQKAMPDGTKKITGYRQTEDSRSGTTTRTYADGRRVTEGRDYERRSVGGGLDFVTRNNGLREAVLADGRPAYQDRFATARDHDGREQRVIERTRYAHWDKGRPVFDAQPVVRHYDIGQLHGHPVAQYRPSRFSPEYYRGFKSRWAVPVAVASAAAWVAFQSPSRSYSDPVELMGDLQISSGFEEGYSYATSDGGSPVYDTPEAAALRSQMAAVQKQVVTNAQDNPALRDQIGTLDMAGTSSRVQQSVGAAVPVRVSEEVRLQVHKQVRLSVAMHQNGRALALPDLLASGYARIYLFQAAQPINVSGAASAAECFLNTGDLISFAKVPGTEEAFAQMNVVASSANSCQPGEVVQVRLTDLQEMLNGFSERVEDNMKRVTACAASGGC